MVKGSEMLHTNMAPTLSLMDLPDGMKDGVVDISSKGTFRSVPWSRQRTFCAASARGQALSGRKLSFHSFLSPPLLIHTDPGVCQAVSDVHDQVAQEPQNHIEHLQQQHHLEVLLGGMTRYVRASMSEALSLDCIRTARAKGLVEKPKKVAKILMNTVFFSGSASTSLALRSNE